MTSCWLRLSQPARQMSKSCRTFTGRSCPTDFAQSSLGLRHPEPPSDTSAVNFRTVRGRDGQLLIAPRLGGCRSGLDGCPRFG